MGKIKNIASALLDLVFVPRCAACGTALPDKKPILCESCKKMYETESKLRCTACGYPHPKCICRINYKGYSFPFVHITSYSLRRNSASRNIMLGIKDENQKEVFEFLSDELVKALTDREEFGYLRAKGSLVVTYVPRSEGAKRKAGHDQSEILAKTVSERLGAKFITVFSNIGDASQKTLDKKRRGENAEENYGIICERTDIYGKNVILIDDIVTSGASIGVCAMLLKNAGANNIVGLVCAKTDNRRGRTEEKY